MWSKLITLSFSYTCHYKVEGVSRSPYPNIICRNFDHIPSLHAGAGAVASSPVCFKTWEIWWIEAFGCLSSSVAPDTTVGSIVVILSAVDFFCFYHSPAVLHKKTARLRLLHLPANLRSPFFLLFKSTNTSTSGEPDGASQGLRFR